MAENTKIQWCDHTFNPWRGCTKVAAGCTNCYADTLSKRNHGTLGIWGPNGTRVMASNAMWREPVKWNRKAACDCNRRGDLGESHLPSCPQRNRPRVFCASLCDVFEDWDGPIVDHKGRKLFTWMSSGEIAAWEDMPQNALPNCRPTSMNDLRADLFRLIDATPNLDWLLPTKRPENIRRMRRNRDGQIAPYEYQEFRQNCWLGTSVATQADADRNIPELLKCRDLSPCLFVSAEPLVGPVDFSPWLGNRECVNCGNSFFESELTPDRSPCPRCYTTDAGNVYGVEPYLDWLIVGGESGHNARSCNVEWIRSAVEQCKAADVAVFVKQLGSNPTYNSGATRAIFNDPKGGDIDEFPANLQVREFPNVQ